MRFTSTIAVLFLAAVLCAPSPANAELIGNFSDWSAFAETEGGKKVCFIASSPQKDEGKYTKRGDIVLMVTHRPDEKSLNVISIDAGYTYKKDSEATAIIGANKFPLFTDGGYAWAYDSKSDHALVRAMRVGVTMIVRGASSLGTKTKDTYSLKGFTAAHKAINKACGVK